MGASTIAREDGFVARGVAPSMNQATTTSAGSRRRRVLLTSLIVVALVVAATIFWPRGDDSASTRSDDSATRTATTDTADAPGIEATAPMATPGPTEVAARIDGAPVTLRGAVVVTQATKMGGPAGDIETTFLALLPAPATTCAAYAQLMMASPVGTPPAVRVPLGMEGKGFSDPARLGRTESPIPQYIAGTVAQPQAKTSGGSSGKNITLLTRLELRPGGLVEGKVAYAANGAQGADYSARGAFSAPYCGSLPAADLDATMSSPPSHQG